MNTAINAYRLVHVIWRTLGSISDWSIVIVDISLYPESKNDRRKLFNIIHHRSLERGVMRSRRAKSLLRLLELTSRRWKNTLDFK
jgi:hypothetical protein